VALGASAAALLALGTLATAATVVVGNAGGNFQCSAGFDSVQVTSSGDAYVVPAGQWRLVAWSTQGGPQAGRLQLSVWRPTADPETFVLVGMTPAEDVAANVLNTFPLATPIDVQGGDVLGLRVPADAPRNQLCIEVTAAPDATGFRFGPEPVVGEQVTFVPGGLDARLNVQATLESHDAGPGVPTTLAECRGGGWRERVDPAGVPFKNQGDCVSFVATNGRNLAGR
jgi:hypothetical protein